MKLKLGHSALLEIGFASISCFSSQFKWSQSVEQMIAMQ